MTETANHMLWRLTGLEMVPEDVQTHRYSSDGERDSAPGIPWHYDTPTDDDLYANFLLAAVQLSAATSYDGGGLWVGPLVATREQVNGLPTLVDP